MTPFDHVVKGDSDFFKEVALDVLLKSRDDNGDSLLTKAAMENQLDCCKEIYARRPSLIWHVNSFGNTALHHSVWYCASTELVKFLIDAAAKANIEGNMSYKKWLAWQNYEGDTGLSYAVTKLNLDVTRMLMEIDIDHEVSRIPNFKKNTPLHLAVKHQNLELVKLVAVPEPDFKYCPNDEGETPLMIAMREAQPSGNSDDNNSVKIRKLLLEMQPSQSKVRINDNGWTSLHYATNKKDIGAIDDIIRFCPGCMELVDNERQNFLHLAVKLGLVEVVKRVLELREIANSVLNGKDNYGNTPFIIAVEAGNQSIVEFLLYDHRVDRMVLNAKGEKVIEKISFDYDKEIAGVYGVRDRVNEKELKEQSDFDLVVGALIATVSFTVGITVPGGYISEGPNRGMAVLSRNISFEVFVISNNFALVFSLYAVFSHFCTRRLIKREDILYQLHVATFCTLSAIFAMMVAFITGSYAVLAISNRIAITVCVNSCCFFIFAFRALFRMGMQYRLGMQNRMGRQRLP